MTPVVPSTPQLLDLAEAMRGTEWRDQLEQAMTAAVNAGWSWPKRCRMAFQLLLDDEAVPFSMRDAARDPVSRTAATGDPHAGAAYARQLLEQRGGVQ